MKQLNHIKPRELGQLLPNYIEINGVWVHKSQATKKPPATCPEPSVEPKDAATAYNPIPRDWGMDDRVAQLYKKAKAILIVQGKAKSNNSVKWKHWLHHFRSRKTAVEQIQNAVWHIPFNGSLPTRQTTSKVRLEFVKHGGRLMDKINFAEGCKGLVDELVAQGYLFDDNPIYLDQDYHQVKGKESKIEILFM